MARVAELEAIVSGRSAPGPTWDVPAGDVLTLLRDDALTRRDATGAAARRATAPWLVAIADEALADSDVAPPSHVEALVMGVTLRARPGEGVEGVNAALEKARTPQHPVTQREQWITRGLLAGSAVFLAAAVVDSSDLQWLYWMVAIGAAIWGAVRLVERYRRQRDDSARITRGIAFVEREAAALEKRAAQAVQVARGTRQDARDHHARVVAVLGGAAPSTPSVLGDAGAVTDAPADDDASDPDGDPVLADA